MTLADVLRRLWVLGLDVEVEGEKAYLHGETSEVTDDLRAGIAEHRPELLRLYRRPKAWPPWRAALAEADFQTREAWAELAEGYERHHPDWTAEQAEFYAWTLLHPEEEPGSSEPPPPEAP